MHTTNTERQQGFTLIEFLMASLILLVVILGVIPFFTNALSSNLSGEESTQVTSHARSGVEEFVQQNFNNWEIEITGGTELTNTDYWSTGVVDEYGDEGWIDGQLPSTGIDKYERTQTVRQFQLTGVVDADGDGVLERLLGLEDTDGDGEFDNPLPAGTSRQAVHYKEIVVDLANRREAGVLGAPSDLALRFIKSF